MGTDGILYLKLADGRGGSQSGRRCCGAQNGLVFTSSGVLVHGWDEMVLVFASGRYVV